MSEEASFAPADASRRIRVLVVDDHPLFRRGLVRVLEEQPDMVVVGEADTGRRAVELACSLGPDVVLMDIKMPDMGGVEACARICSDCPAKVIALTVSDQDEDLFGAIKAGARGYLLKSVAEAELLDAIRRVYAGEAVIAPPLAVRVLQELAARPAEPAREQAGLLSPREEEILRLAASGLTNKEIADRLHLSAHTVKTHLRRVLDKLHARNRAQAAALAARHGLIRRGGPAPSDPPSPSR